MLGVTCTKTTDIDDEQIGLSLIQKTKQKGKDKNIKYARLKYILKIIAMKQTNINIKTKKTNKDIKQDHTSYWC
jgi:hypothetical protein